MKLFRQLFVLLTLVGFTLPSMADMASFEKGKSHHQGFFSFYQDDKTGKVYLSVDKFDQPFLFQSSMPHGIGSNDIGLDRGQLGDTRLVQFERVGDKVFLRQLNTYYRANSDNVLERQAIDEAFASSIIWGFKVTETSDKGAAIVDYTPFLLSDIHGVSERLKKSKQGNFKIDASRSGLYSKRTKAFPKNTEFEATITFKGSGAGTYLKSVTPDNSAVTVNFHHSLVELPDDNYQTRVFHPYSGYWAISHADYATAIDEPLIQRVIPRHRLSKKNPNADVSEAVEPIVYYLDAGVPEPVKSALLDGARWWDQAFEAIGYKKAFQVKMLPSDADPMDVRYNVIQWVHRATRGWSYGASVIDPRTGEIIKGHVTLGSLRVRQDYLIALGLTSPFKAATADTSPMKEMALARIRQLSAHEVGHTLGIAHNFSASVNNRASVMDYPHPLVKITKGKIDLSQAYDTDIGDWDKFVVAYGYSDLAQKEESEVLADLIAKAQAQGLQYMSDPDARPKSGGHATGHLWDNGESAADELERVMKVRELALKQFGLNSIATGTPLSEIEQTLVPIYNFHRFQVEAAAKLIAGVEYSYEVKGDSKANEKAKGVRAVAGKSQKKALKALLNTLDAKTLTLDEELIALIPPKAYGYSRNRESFKGHTGITFDPISAAEASAKHTLSLLLNAQRLARLQQQSNVLGKDHKGIPSVAELFEEVLDQTIKQTDSKGLSLLVQQRINQQVVEHLLTLWHKKQLVTEVRSEVYVALVELSSWLNEKATSRKFKQQKAQYMLLSQQIDYSLAQGKLAAPVSTIKLPPGSPIGSE
ncbi:zinc-dependent metalloprotease [Thalassotalea atypica]|uniref:zinc-dependent metalloprotease n=1 Tax=Thalassotalea atypica TaxID=2054316 RepID=UPI0025734691|nr:zinc-dependent metalloprotease [Thalassotalea atypica]